MTPSQLVKLGAGLQRMKDRLDSGHVWRVMTPEMYVDGEGITWELTKAGWQSVMV